MHTSARLAGGWVLWVFALVSAIAFLPCTYEAQAGDKYYGGGGGGKRGGGGISGRDLGIIGGAIILNEVIKQRQQNHDRERYDRPPRDRYRPEKVREPKKRGCPDGWSYSRKRGKCTPPREEAKLNCKFPYVRGGRSCVCAAGYLSRRGKCLKDKPIEIAEPKCAYPRVRDGKSCVCAAGYVSRRGKCLKDKPVEIVEPRRDPPPVREAKPRDPEPPVVRSPKPKAAAALAAISPLPASKARCLPQDLVDLLEDAYGAAPQVAACETACLPKPSGFGEAQLQKAVADSGVAWCNSCIALDAWLPLPAILRLEEATGETFCAAPADLCVYPGVRAGAKKTDIRTLFRDLPDSIDRDGAIAIVIGNEIYGGETPANTNAHADAESIETLLVEQLGYAKENIVSLRDAKLADLDLALGGADADGGDLLKRIGARADADVLIYVSSHGLVDVDGRAYLAPADVDAARLAESAYPMSRLYDNLRKTGARTIMLALETTFASDLAALAEPPNLPGAEIAVMPETPVPGLAVFKASDRDQRTLEDPEFGIGLFTRYFIEGLAGKADGAPLGNGDRRIDTVELFVYTADIVRMAARKSFGLEQKPILAESSNLVVGRLAAR